jgi:hypothetical protein
VTAQHYILLGIVLAVGVGFVVYFLLRFLKGRLTLTLQKQGCAPGESFAGMVEVFTKRPVEGNRLYVALIGEEEIRQRSGKRTRTTRHEIFRSEVELEGSRHYPPGFHQGYSFELPAPERESAAPNPTSSDWAKTIEMGMSLLTGRTSRLVWRVEARLEAKGVDLVAHKRVAVSPF